jgi:hypothetical protein
MTINPLQIFSSFKYLPQLLTIMLLGLFLQGCNNSDKSSKKSFSIQQKTQKYTKPTTLKGKVSNGKGVIGTGEIKVTDYKDKLVASTQLQKGSHYSVTVPADTVLPITLTFYPDANDSTDKDKLISIAIYTSIKKYDINELTTLIAKRAKTLGGYTHSNMVLAADSTVGIPDANKTSTGFRGDPTKQYGGWH